MKKAVIFSGGPYKKPDAEIFKDAECVVCADGGFISCINAGIVPDVVIGDMDSIAEIPECAEIVRADTHKDQTDTQLCVDYLIDRGYKDIVVACALGGREDHSFANLMLTAYGAERGVKLTLADEGRTVMLITGRKVLRAKPGDILSLFPIGGNCTVTAEGLRYPLNSETLYYHTPRGISNIFQSDRAVVTAENGQLIAIIITEKQL